MNIGRQSSQVSIGRWLPDNTLDWLIKPSIEQKPATFAITAKPCANVQRNHQVIYPAKTEPTSFLNASAHKNNPTLLM
ncbi:MAG: hypothetical protein HC866_19635 [Leptolyngbyaceae cyanobacterium RU_5_1]|nr:hypothetical protein [Leptolyngbyaceae cyanobacterium RU_5_1]